MPADCRLPALRRAAALTAAHSYGASKAVAEAYKKRGIGSFGIIAHGSCGYTQDDG